LSPSRVKNSFFSTASRPTLGPTQPPIQWVPGALSPGVKRQGHEAGHPAPTSAKVKKMWICTSTPLDSLMAQCLNTDFLKVIIGSNLSWEVHIERTCSRISQSLFIINRLSKIHDLNKRIKFVSYLVRHTIRV
jgi:hypothetical protein